MRNYHLLSPPPLGSRSPAFFRPLSLEPSAGRGLRAGAPFGLRFSAPEGPRGPHAARGCAGLPPPAARLAHHGAPKPAAPGGRREGASHQCPHARTHPERPRLIRDSRGITRARGATAYVPNSQPETDWGGGSFPAPRAATSWSRFPRGPGARLFGAEREEGSGGHVGARAEPGGARADFVDRAASLGRTSRPESPERPGLPVRKAETGFYPWERRPRSSGAASEGEEGPRGSGISGREVRSPRAKGRRSGPFGPAATSVELSVRQEALRRLLRAARAGGGPEAAPPRPSARRQPRGRRFRPGLFATPSPAPGLRSEGRRGGWGDE